MIITVVNHKGGVGKTSFTVNMATALGNKNKKVLVIDNDPQSNATRILLKDPYQKQTMYELLDPDHKETIDIDNFIYPTKCRNVSILPNVDATSGLEIALANNFPASQFRIRNQIREYATQNFDITLIDCQPTLGLFVANAMIAADAVIVPVDAGSSYSIDNLYLVLEMIKVMRQTSNIDLKFLKIVINRTDRRTTVCKVLIDEILKRFGKEQVFESKIPASTVVQQAEYAKETIFKWAPGSATANAYREIAKELITVVNGG